jgi:hypothetical protein
MRVKLLKLSFSVSMAQFAGASIVMVLTSCASPEQLAEQDAAVCNKSGFTTGTEDFLDCMNRTAGDRERRAAEIGHAIAAGLKSYGESSQQNYNNYQATRPRQTYCYSSGYGHGVTTNCTTY